MKSKAKDGDMRPGMLEEGTQPVQEQILYKNNTRPVQEQISFRLQGLWSLFQIADGKIKIQF